MCCHEFLARLLLGKDEQDQGLSHSGIQLQATERCSGSQTAYDRRTARTVQVRQEHSARQHDSGAVSGLLRKDLYRVSQHPRRRQLEAGQEVHRGGNESAGGPRAGVLRGLGRSSLAQDHQPAAQDHRDQQAAEDAIPLPNFDRGGRRGRHWLPEQENWQLGDRHAVCSRQALPDQHSGQHPKAAPRKQRRSRQQPILLHLEIEEPAGEGQPAGGADGAGAQAAAGGDV